MELFRIWLTFLRISVQNLNFFYNFGSIFEPLRIFGFCEILSEFKMTMAEPISKQKDSKIDSIDRQILSLLISNARSSTRTIVKNLSDMGTEMSERGVGKRITRLEKVGIIRGYTTMVDLTKVNMPVLRLITVKFTSPKDFVERLTEMKQYLTDAPFCDFSARTNGNIDWIELKFFNNHEQAQQEEDLYRAWFGDIMEDFRSYDLDIHKMHWQIFDENDFHRFINNTCKKEGTQIYSEITRKSKSG
jgi:DNA-binding Lrp family transcriptional regulator